MDLLPKSTGRVEAMANLIFLFRRYYIVAWDMDRLVSMNTRGLGTRIDVALFGSEFVSANTAKI